MDRLIFIFLDGVGLGEAKQNNPFYLAKSEYLPFYRKKPVLPDGTPIKAIDPLLGVSGIPRSATGQTTLFTGSNIPALLNEHKGSYPNQIMRKIIFENNLLGMLKKKNLKAKFINAYPHHTKFFTSDHIKIHADGRFEFSEEFPQSFRRRISATSCMLIANNDLPFDENDILKEEALYQDFSNRFLIDKGIKLPLFSPQKAASIIYKISQKYDFILYEYFQTDLYGHRKTFKDCVNLVTDLNLLVQSLLTYLDPDSDTILLTSDHGNIEDNSSPAHTKNPVPLLLWGNKSKSLRDKIDNLTHIAPGINHFFSVK